MRKAQKQEIFSLVDSLHQAHEEIKRALEQKNIILAQNMLSEVQESAIFLGEYIEKIEGEGHVTISAIEEYCEFLFNAFEVVNENDFHAYKVYKMLRRQLIKIENSVKNDIIIRKEIVFFPYKASMWDSLESIYLAAKEDPECDAYCVPIPYYDVKPDHSLGQMHYEGGDYPEEIEITDWQEYCFEERRPDAIYIHNPYDGYNLVTSVHPRFYSSNLKKYTDILVYVPYYVTSGTMMEAQSFFPSYQYIDYIVIQSPQFRKYFHQNIPDEKFLPFGSPKIDQVIRKCQNPPTPPETWLEQMKGKDGKRKRVIFYNTGISAMLNDTETFLKKMNYVFRCFMGREDVCLLWRPHPLLESTFDSMKPEYRPVYDALKKIFLEHNLGIYDTTPDIEESIALSDAYIGDAGTSVTALFGVAGKPIFILDNSILSKQDKDSWREKIGINFNYLEQDRFVVMRRNKLYISEGGRYNYRFFCNLSDNTYRKEYSIIWQIDGKKYACPAYAQKILRIGEERIEKEICLKQEIVGGRAFIDAWKYDRFLILLPLHYPALVRYDTKTEECAYFMDKVNVFVKDREGQMISGGSWVDRGSLYLTSPVDNIVCRFEIESGKSQLITIPKTDGCGCNLLTAYRNQIWMLPYAGKTIVRWNPQTGEIKEYSEFPEGFCCVSSGNDRECGEPLFGSMAFFEECLYLTPLRANMYLRLNIDTGKITRWEPPLEIREVKNRKTGDEGIFVQEQPEDGRGWIKIFLKESKRLYHINMRTNECEEIEVRFNRKELEENEAGFCECSESLKYGCVESVFNTLDRFLDGVMVGNPFDKEKQLKAYRELVANTDGNCGRKIYECIKAQE